ncbi:unnamed protein product, partial [Callosobruchus maculatus]
QCCQSEHFSAIFALSTIEVHFFHTLSKIAPSAHFLTSAIAIIECNIYTRFQVSLKIHIKIINSEFIHFCLSLSIHV